ncbi:MAG: hypothetical protein II215_01360, partial [Paludibacteraceae bacterium]|nr:hypothetical protein [Paludibacteraceae bacterium]
LEYIGRQALHRGKMIFGVKSGGQEGSTYLWGTGLTVRFAVETVEESLREEGLSADIKVYKTSKSKRDCVDDRY